MFHFGGGRGTGRGLGGLTGMTDPLMAQLQEQALEIVDRLAEQFGAEGEAMTDLANYMPPASVLDELVIEELRRRAAAAAASGRDAEDRA